MSTQSRNDDVSDLQEAEEEEEVLKLEEEVKQVSQNILEYRTTLPGQLILTLSSLLVSQRPVLPTHLVDEGSEPETRTLSGPDSEAGVGEDESKITHFRGMKRENMVLLVSEDKEETEKIQLLIQTISSNTTTLPLVLNMMKEYMARIDKLESSNVIIHPAFKRKRTS